MTFSLLCKDQAETMWKYVYRKRARRLRIKFSTSWEKGTRSSSSTRTTRTSSTAHPSWTSTKTRKTSAWTATSNATAPARASLPSTARAEESLDINSYAWGLSVSRHLTFKGVSRTIVILQSLRPKMVIASKETLTTYLLYRLPSKFRWIEKKIISHWPFLEFHQKKANSSGCKSWKRRWNSLKFLCYV